MPTTFTSSTFQFWMPVSSFPVTVLPRTTADDVSANAIPTWNPSTWKPSMTMCWTFSAVIPMPDPPPWSSTSPIPRRVTGASAVPPRTKLAGAYVPGWTATVSPARAMRRPRSIVANGSASVPAFRSSPPTATDKTLPVALGCDGAPLPGLGLHEFPAAGLAWVV